MPQIDSDHDLLAAQFVSYDQFLERLPSLIQRLFPSELKIGERSLALKTHDIRVLPPERPEAECLERGMPYRHRILMDLEIEERKPRTALLGRIPALTSRGTLLYGSFPGVDANSSRLYERVPILQLRVLPEIAIARALKRQRERLETEGRVYSNKEGHPEEFPERLHDEWKRLAKAYRKRRRMELASLEELLELDSSPDLGNYEVLAIGDHLERAVVSALRRITGALNALEFDEEIETFFLPALPDLFAELVERALNRTKLIQFLDKTNPLAEVAHKRKVTFCGSGGLRNLEGDEKQIPERAIDPSHAGRLCPVETPESERVGLNLHLAADASVDFERRRLEAGNLGLGVSAALIPFIGHNDPNRALMAAKNMKQALPLQHPDRPLIQTGWETRVAQASNLCLYAAKDGEIKDCHAGQLIIRYDDEDEERVYSLIRTGGVVPGIGSFYRLPAARTIRAPWPGRVADVRPGKKVVLRGDWGGARFEEGIPVSKEDLIIVREDESVEAGQEIAVQRRFRRGEVLADASATVDGSLVLGANLLVAYMPWYGYNFEDALVISERLAREDVLTSLHLSVVPAEENAPGDQGDGKTLGTCLTSRRVEVGDKLCNRHGHKGVIARIESDESMPVLLSSDGQLLTDERGDPLRVDLLVNPHSVISRMNLGQLYETHWSWAAWKRGESLTIPPFDRGYDLDRLQEELSQDGLHLTDGKTKVRWKDLFTGEKKEATVVTGWQYWLKVNHLAQDKLHYRTDKGPRTLLTRQPSKGKRRKGGQRIGEMEVWALQALQADRNLDEILTVKSDALPSEGSGHSPFPEALRAFIFHLRGLGIDVQLYVKDEEGERPFPVETLEEPFDPRQIVRVEARWADESQIKRWSKGEVTSPDYLSLWLRCEDCGHGDWRSRKLRTSAGKPGPRRCPKCQSARIEQRLRWHPEGLFSEKCFGEQKANNPARRLRMGHITLYEPIPHPLSPERQFQVLPVIPPAYRPLLEHGEGLNRWYRNILITNSLWEGSQEEDKQICRRRVIKEIAGLYGKRVKKGSPTSITDPESNEGIAFKNDNGDHDNLRRRLNGKTGLVRGALLGKRVDFSGRAVIVPDPQLPFGRCRLPRDAAEGFCTRFVGLLSSLSEKEQVSKLRGWWQDRPLLLNRAPTLHRYNFLASVPHRERPFWDASVLAIHPLICGMYNADFDGDAMAFHLPLDEKALAEARARLTPERHLFSIAHGGSLLHLSQDIVSGTYLMTRSGEGQSRFAELLGLDLADRSVNTPLDKEALREMVDGFLEMHLDDPDGLAEALQRLDQLMREAFREATKHGLSFSIHDLEGLRLERSERRKIAKKIKEEHDKEKHDKDKWNQKLRERIGTRLKEGLEAQQDNPAAILVSSGARGNQEQLARLCGAVIGLPENFVESPLSSYVDGLEEREYFEAAREARPDIVRKKVGPARGGDLTRKLIYGCYPVRIVEDQCADTEGFPFSKELAHRLEGRHLSKAVGSITQKGNVITQELIPRLTDADTDRVSVFSPITCRAKEGVCQRCYGKDPSTGREPEMGLPVGLIAAQSIGERATQDFMKAFHGVRLQTLEEIEAAKAFFEWGKLPEDEAAEVLRWLCHDVYSGKVDPRHFEVVLGQMDILTQPIGMVEATKRRLHTGFLGVVAFQAVTAHMVKAAEDLLADDLDMEPASLFLSASSLTALTPRMGTDKEKEDRSGEGGS